MKTSNGLINPGANFEDQIVLYDRAFEGPFSLSRVITHELAHEFYVNMIQAQKTDYNSATGWLPIQGGRKFQTRSGDFIRSEGQDSPEEDFAINIESYLFEPSQLQKIVPKAFVWIDKKYSSHIKFKECKNAQKK